MCQLIYCIKNYKVIKNRPVEFKITNKDIYECQLLISRVSLPLNIESYKWIKV